MKKTVFIRKKYLSLLMPITAGMLINSLVGIIDRILSGFVLGSSAVVAVSVVLPLRTMTMFLSYLVSVGTGILVINSTGRYEAEKKNEYFSMGLILSIALGALLFLGISLFGDLYFSQYELDISTRYLLREYLRWTVPQLTILPLYCLLLEMIADDGDDAIYNTVVYTYLAAKAVSSFLLVRVLGIAGLSLGSFISMALACLTGLLHFIKPSNTLHFRRFFKFRIIPDIAKYSFIDSFDYLNNFVVNTVINIFVAAAYGEKNLVVFSCICALMEIMDAFDASNCALAPLLGSYIGEDNPLGTQRVYMLSIRAAAVEGVILNALLFIFAGSVVRLLGVNDSEVFAPCVTAVRIYSFASIPVAVVYAVTSYYLVQEQIASGVIVSFVAGIAALLPLMVLLTKPFGMEGLWIGGVLAPIIALALYSIFMRPGDLKKSSGRMENSRIYDIRVAPGSIAALNDEIEVFLTGKGVERSPRLRVRLLLEELLMNVCDRNGESSVDAEISVILDEKLFIIVRDNGVLYDSTDTDSAVTSIRSFVLSSLMEAHRYKKYLITTSYNRNKVEFEV